MTYRLVGILLGILISASLGFQCWQLYQFVNIGSRFTAKDGQALCERVKALEERVKALKERPQGYRDAGKTPMSCDYNLPSELR